MKKKSINQKKRALVKRKPAECYAPKTPMELSVGDVFKISRKDYKPAGTECIVIKIEERHPDDEFTILYAKSPSGVLYYRHRNISKSGNQRMFYVLKDEYKVESNNE